MPSYSNYPAGAATDRNAPFNSPWIEDETCEICLYPLQDHEAEICDACWQLQLDEAAAKAIVESDVKAAA